MTALAIVIMTDLAVAFYVLGLAHCKDVPVAAPLPRRVPGAALVDNPPDPYAFTFKPDDSPFTRAAVVRPPYVAPSQTIGDRARARGADATREFYRQKWVTP